MLESESEGFGVTLSDDDGGGGGGEFEVENALTVCIGMHVIQINIVTTNGPEFIIMIIFLSVHYEVPVIVLSCPLYGRIESFADKVE